MKDITRDFSSRNTEYYTHLMSTSIKIFLLNQLLLRCFLNQIFKYMKMVEIYPLVMWKS